MTDPANLYWLLLTAQEQQAAVKRMSAQGWGDYQIASATRLSVEAIRRVIGERRKEDLHHA